MQHVSQQRKHRQNSSSSKLSCVLISSLAFCPVSCDNFWASFKIQLYFVILLYCVARRKQATPVQVMKSREFSFDWVKVLLDDLFANRRLLRQWRFCLFSLFFSCPNTIVKLMVNLHVSKLCFMQTKFLKNSNILLPVGVFVCSFCYSMNNCML